MQSLNLGLPLAIKWVDTRIGEDRWLYSNVKPGRCCHQSSAEAQSLPIKTAPGNPLQIARSIDKSPNKRTSGDLLGAGSARGFYRLHSDRKIHRDNCAWLENDIGSMRKSDDRPFRQCVEGGFQERRIHQETPNDRNELTQ
jgi:Zn ribbon nucleic-acid-binding protein